VVIDGAVVPDGTVRHLRVVSGDPLLAQAAMDAIKGWRYRAASARGKKQSDTRITVNFVLAENPRVASAAGSE
jgi:outer membrane biosynthesis protein TonB